MAANGRNHTVLLGRWASFRFAGRAACALSCGVLARTQAKSRFQATAMFGRAGLPMLADAGNCNAAHAKAA